MTCQPPTPDYILLRRADLRDLLEDVVASGERRWLAVDSAAEYADLSTKSIRRLLSSGKLDAHRPCKGKVLIDKRQLDALISGSTALVRTGRGRQPVRKR